MKSGKPLKPSVGVPRRLLTADHSGRFRRYEKRGLRRIMGSGGLIAIGRKYLLVDTPGFLYGSLSMDESCGHCVPCATAPRMLSCFEDPPRPRRASGSRRAFELAITSTRRHVASSARGAEPGSSTSGISKTSTWPCGEEMSGTRLSLYVSASSRKVPRCRAAKNCPSSYAGELKKPHTIDTEK